MGSVTVMPVFSHARNLFAAEVTAVGDDIEALHFQRRLRLLGHMCQLRPVDPDVGHLMHNNQMMCGVDGDLDRRLVLVLSADALICAMLGPSWRA